MGTHLRKNQGDDIRSTARAVPQSAEGWNARLVAELRLIPLERLGDIAPS
jgi:hypothetical protein